MVPIAGDGNCLFRALTWPEEHRHAMARADVVAHMRAHWEDAYAAYCDEACDEYCTRMARDGVWGGELELRAFADVTRTHVHVHGADGGHIASYHPHHPSNTQCHVRYAHGHYDRLTEGQM